MMKNLVDLEMLSFLGYMLQIKECQDECSEDITKYFPDSSSRFDEFEADAYELLPDFYAYYDQKPLFYDYGDNGISEAERDPDGEAWFFSTDEMVEFYKLLKDLRKKKVITKKEHENHKLEMEDNIRRCILYTQGYGYSGVYCDILYAKGKKVDAVEVGLDFNCPFSLFSLYCGVIMLFDKYKVKLQELKEKYCKKQILEAA